MTDRRLVAQAVELARWLRLVIDSGRPARILSPTRRLVGAECRVVRERPGRHWLEVTPDAARVALRTLEAELALVDVLDVDGPAA